MGFVAIDGPTAFPAGGVAKAAPVQQMDQNVDAMNEHQHPLAPAAPSAGPHRHRGGNDGSYVSRLNSTPQGFYTGSGSSDSNAIHPFVETQMTWAFDTGGVWVPSVTGWLVELVTEHFRVPNGVSSLTIRTFARTQISGRRADFAIGIGLDSVVSLAPNDPDSYDDKSTNVGSTTGFLKDVIVPISPNKIGQLVRMGLLDRFRTSTPAAWTWYDSVGQTYFHRWD